MKRLVAYSLCLLAFAAAAPVALGQSAGDQQYTDPFNGEEQAQSSPGTARGDQSQSGNSGQTGSGTATPAPSSAPAAQTTAARSGSSSKLAYTGFPAALVALLGACALVAGLMVRLLAGWPAAPRRDAVMVLGRDVRLQPRGRLR
jgi:hypothetical protein